MSHDPDRNPAALTPDEDPTVSGRRAPRTPMPKSGIQGINVSEALDLLLTKLDFLDNSIRSITQLVEIIGPSANMMRGDLTVILFRLHKMRQNVHVIK